MYEYVDGKVDWMAYGLPVEGEAGPFAGSAVTEVLTCTPGEAPGDVAARVEASDHDHAVVVTDGGVVLGTAGAEALLAAEKGQGIVDLMEPSPSTIRFHTELAELDERAAGVLVTTPDGVLFGAVDAEAIAREGGAKHDELEQELHDVLRAVHEHFGDREPGEDELRAFLRSRLLDKGRTPEEADRMLADMTARAHP